MDLIVSKRDRIESGQIETNRSRLMPRAVANSSLLRPEGRDGWLGGDKTFRSFRLGRGSRVARRAQLASFPSGRYFETIRTIAEKIIRVLSPEDEAEQSV
jgi:hypothetical protein